MKTVTLEQGIEYFDSQSKDLSETSGGSQAVKVDPLNEMKKMSEALHWFAELDTPVRRWWSPFKKQRKSHEEIRDIICDRKNFDKLLYLRRAVEWLHIYKGINDFEIGNGKTIPYNQLMIFTKDLIIQAQARQRYQDILNEALRKNRR